MFKNLIVRVSHHFVLGTQSYAPKLEGTRLTS